MNRICFVFVAGFGLLGLTALGGDNPYAGLKFKLDFRSSETNITSRAVGNALDYSSASSVNAATAGGDVASNKVQHVVVKAPDLLYPWQTNDVDVLRFPQRTKTEDDALKSMPVALDFANGAVTGDTLTFYFRFYWDGPVDQTVAANAWLVLNGYDWSTPGEDDAKGVGCGVCIYPDTGNPGKAALGVLSRQSTPSTWNLMISEKTWYDYFVTFEPSATDATKSKVTFTIVTAPVKKAQYAGPLPTMTSVTLVDKASRLAFSSSKKNLRLGSEGALSSYGSTSSNYGYNSKCFRGDISRFMIWDRKLSTNEMWQVASGACGVDWKLGADNGQADEFAAADAAESTWCVTNGWRTLRRALTETKPTWTIRCPVVPREAGMAKILEIKPILSGGTSFPVEVAVNGKLAGTYDLASTVDRVIPLRAKLWKADADGFATITVTRKTPFAGTLELDSMALCGGWTMKNGTDGEMTQEGFVRADYNIGLTDPRTVQRATAVVPDGLNGARNSPYVGVTAYVPEVAIANHDYTFSVKASGRISEFLQPHALLVNGQEVARSDGFEAGDILSCKVPKECLVPGQNVFTVTNLSDVTANKSKWTSFYYYTIEVKDHTRGMCIIFR